MVDPPCWLQFMVLFLSHVGDTLDSTFAALPCQCPAFPRLLSVSPHLFYRVMKVAQSFLDAGHKLNFAVASRKTFGHELSEFGLDGTTGDVPVVAIRTAKGEKYVMQEEFS